MMEIAGVILFVVAAVLAVEWVIAYHRKTGGAWRRKENPMSRHLMVFMTAIAAVLSLGAVRSVMVNVLDHDDPFWFRVVRLVVSASIPVVILWRRILLARAQSDIPISRR